MYNTVIQEEPVPFFWILACIVVGLVVLPTGVFVLMWTRKLLWVRRVGYTSAGAAVN